MKCVPEKAVRDLAEFLSQMETVSSKNAANMVLSLLNHQGCIDPESVDGFPVDESGDAEYRAKKLYGQLLQAHDVAIKIPGSTKVDFPDFGSGFTEQKFIELVAPLYVAAPPTDAAIEQFAENLTGTLMQTCEGVDPEDADEADEISRIIAINVRQLLERKHTSQDAIEEAVRVILKDRQGCILDRSLAKAILDAILPILGGRKQ